jgi:hypothetical protein
MVCYGALRFAVLPAREAQRGPAAAAVAVAMLARSHSQGSSICSWLLGAESKLLHMRSCEAPPLEEVLLGGASAAVL